MAGLLPSGLAGAAGLAAPDAVVFARLDRTSASVARTLSWPRMTFSASRLDLPVGGRRGARARAPRSARPSRPCPAPWRGASGGAGSCDGRAVLAEPRRERLLRVAVLLHQAVERLGELDRVQVLALDVLDERELERLRLGRRPSRRPAPRAARRFWLARQRRSPAMISNWSVPEPFAARRAARGARARGWTAASSSSAFASKCCRGCPFCGTIFSSAQTKRRWSPGVAAPTAPSAGARRARGRARASCVGAVAHGGHCGTALAPEWLPAATPRSELVVAREQLAREREVALRAACDCTS